VIRNPSPTPPSHSTASESETAQSSKRSKDWTSLSDDDSQSPTHVQSVWEKIVHATAQANKNRLQKSYHQDRSHFKRKFCDAYIYRVKEWLLELDEFVKNDVYWEAIVDTRVHGSESDSDDEALLSAIDKRKYRLYKAINWDIVESVMEDESDDESEMSVQEEESDENFDMNPKTEGSQEQVEADNPSSENVSEDE
jgi:hypothetical protein